MSDYFVNQYRYFWSIAIVTTIKPEDPLEADRKKNNVKQPG